MDQSISDSDFHMNRNYQFGKHNTRVLLVSDGAKFDLALLEVIRHPDVDFAVDC